MIEKPLLLKCPFCGSKDIKTRIDRMDRCNKDYHHVICQSCFVSMEGYDKELCVQRWNTRNSNYAEAINYEPE